MPSVLQLLESISYPDASVAEYLGVTTTTLRRYAATERAPKAAKLALFWLSPWGKSHLDADTANAISMHVQLNRILRNENAALKNYIRQLEQVGSFGAANAPKFDPGRQQADRQRYFL